MSGFWQLSFDLGSRGSGPGRRKLFRARRDLGHVCRCARRSRYSEPLPGEFRLWPTTRLRALFPDETDVPESLVDALSETLRHSRRQRCRPSASRIVFGSASGCATFHAMRFGRTIVDLPASRGSDRSRARSSFGWTRDWRSERVLIPPRRCASNGWTVILLTVQRVIDFGCGSGVLAVAAVKLGASEAHCFDIDPQALTATRENAAANDVQSRVSIHESGAALPTGRGCSRGEHPLRTVVRAGSDLRVPGARRRLDRACGAAGTQSQPT